MSAIFGSAAPKNCFCARIKIALQPCVFCIRALPPGSYRMHANDDGDPLILCIPVDPKESKQ